MLVTFMVWERIRFCKVGVLFCGGLLRGLGKIGFGNKNTKSYWVLHLGHPVCKFTRKKVEVENDNLSNQTTLSHFVVYALHNVNFFCTDINLSNLEFGSLCSNPYHIPCLPKTVKGPPKTRIVFMTSYFRFTYIYIYIYMYDSWLS